MHIGVCVCRILQVGAPVCGVKCSKFLRQRVGLAAQKKHTKKQQKQKHRKTNSINNNNYSNSQQRELDFVALL